MLTEITITNPDGTVTHERSISALVPRARLDAFDGAPSHLVHRDSAWPSEAWCADRGISSDTDVSYYEPLWALADYLHSMESSHA